MILACVGLCQALTPNDVLAAEYAGCVVVCRPTGRVLTVERDPARVELRVCGGVALAGDTSAATAAAAAQASPADASAVADDWDIVCACDLLHMVVGGATSTVRAALAARTAAARVPILWITVADTGIGMSREQLQRVVEPFEQADTDTTSRFGGTGLGLSICHDLLKLFGGTLAYTGAVGRGTVFLVAIPAAAVYTRADSPSSFGEPSPATPLAVGPRRALVPRDASIEGSVDGSAMAPSPAARGAPRPLVIVADDNAVNAAVLRHQLEHLGCDVRVAENGMICVNLLASVLQAAPAGAATPTAASDADDADGAQRGQGPVAAVFMDLHMPVLDGVSATAAIRRLEAAAEPPRPPVLVVAVSADDPDELRAACEAVGIRRFIRKPIVLRDLRALVASLPRGDDDA